MTNKPNTRDAILDTASKLFYCQGYHATGLNQIIKDSESPKGSLYYYFPDGKEELALACINRTSENMSRDLRCYMDKGGSAGEAVSDLLHGIAREAEKSAYEGLVPLSFWLAVETSGISDQLQQACRSVFLDWQNVIGERLVRDGFQEEEAVRKASATVSLIEGALLQALTCKEGGPLLAAAHAAAELLNRPAEK
ncbi:putative HTH-type transcriptional regulator YxaF [compost metagenome]